jgi:hypothetical protein
MVGRVEGATGTATWTLPADRKGLSIMDPRLPTSLFGHRLETGVFDLSSNAMTPALGSKVRRFVELSFATADECGSGGSENSESSESSESSENSESSESSESKEACDSAVFRSMLAVNPDPTEWGPLLGAAELVARSSLAPGT